MREKTMQPTKIFAPNKLPSARSLLLFSALVAITTVIISLAPFASASKVAPAMASGILIRFESFAIALETCSSQIKPIRLNLMVIMTN